MIRRLNVSFLSALLALMAASFGCKATKDESSQSSTKQGAVSLAQARHAERDLDISKGSSALITISSNGEYYFGQDAVSQSDIGPKVHEKLKDQPSYYHIVYVKSGKDVQYERMLAVLDSIREAGYDRVGLVVEKEGTKDPVIFEALLPQKVDPKRKEFLGSSGGVLRVPLQRQEPRSPKPDDDIPSLPPSPATPVPPPPQMGKKPTKIPQSIRKIEIPSWMEVWRALNVNSGGTGLDQTVELNSLAKSLGELGSFLKEDLKNMPEDERGVAIWAPKDKRYGDVITVIDVVKGAGANPIVIVVDPEDVRAIRAIRGAIGPIPPPLRQKLDDLPPPPPPPVAGERLEPTKTIRKSGNLLEEGAISKVRPPYPPLAKAARVSGAVIVEITVDEEGNVISARAVSGHPLLKDAAVAAARGWKFRPTLLSGAPVKVIGTLTFNFNK